MGTAITTLVRKADHKPASEVGFRHLWGQAKLSDLTATAEAGPNELYDGVEPSLPLGLPFSPVTVSPGWSNWPALPELFPISFPGVKTSRDSLVVDIELEKLKAGMTDYFNSNVTDDPSPEEDGFIQYAFRPFDTRWLYWETTEKLLDRPRPEYKPHAFEGNGWLVTPRRQRREWSPPLIVSSMGDINQMDGSTSYTPIWLRDEGMSLDSGGTQHRPNLSDAAQRYLDRMGLAGENLFHHVLAVLHDPSYREANAGALRMEWPRLPTAGLAGRRYAGSGG